ncbi:acyl-CoA N-acyltransferase [Myriangium duriaei CBS 260.36]|uniref:Histone acetyltransferase type B catalytic subunit n=1 Tax=Myriangium duriaei CBS 260.36 TaxID=1168546 RepID=A0A9P4IZG0_9PEZI|nr:acyl-CoA N-acyltransferase [Myriangium duriaei CBS 260.36]
MAANDEELTEADQLLADQVAEWSSNSNEAFTVSIVQGDTEIESFNPEFTYPIYGEEEAIFGYQDLEISLAFAAHNLRPHLSIKYKRKFPPQGEIQASDVREPLKDFLPAVAFSETSRDTALADADAPKFVPPGEKIESFVTKHGTYEVWCAPLSDPNAAEILQNMQILVPMFIEGGTILELEYPWIVERWKVFLLYRIAEDTPSNLSQYVFGGYATSFQVFSLPQRGDVLEAELKPRSEAEIDTIVKAWSSLKPVENSPLSLPSRERISQFILLPSHQGSGVGSRLYSSVYKFLTTPSHITELTVEDPNEAFDDMRDISDLIHLRAHNSTFASLTVPTSIPSASLSSSSTIPTSLIVPEDTRRRLARETKIQPRQLSRLIEMQLLSTIPRLHRSTSRITRKDRASNEDDRKYYFWRLLVKERLYQHNRDTLAQLDRAERVEKVDNAAEGVRMDYERLIEAADLRAKMVGPSSRKRGQKRRAADDEDEHVGNGRAELKQRSAAKRKKLQVPDDDDDDEAEGDEEDDSEGEGEGDDVNED